MELVGWGRPEMYGRPQVTLERPRSKEADTCPAKLVPDGHATCPRPPCRGMLNCTHLFCGFHNELLPLRT